MPYARMCSTTTLTSGGVTVIDRQKQVPSWRLLCTLLEQLVPSCICNFAEYQNQFKDKKCFEYYNSCYYRQLGFFSRTTVTGTLFGHRHGKVTFCIQENPKSTSPVLLLELAISTSMLAREMRGGFVRITLECNTCGNDTGSRPLLSMPFWRMSCNGRKVGFAIKRNPSKEDMEVFQLMESVVVAAGTLSGKELKGENDIKYLRGKFQRVQGSPNSASFHLIDPDGNVGQELSFFFLRSH